MIITHCDNSDYVRLCEMSFLAQVGWWEANFATRSFRCSEYMGHRTKRILRIERKEYQTY